MGLDKCIHHYSVLYSVYCPKKILYTLPVLPSHLQLPVYFTVSIVLLPFPEGHLVGIIEYVAFQIGIFHLIHTEDFSMSFCGFVAHLLSVLNNILWSGFTSFFPSPTEGHLGCFQLLAVTNKAVVNIHVQVFMWT